MRKTRRRSAALVLALATLLAINISPASAITLQRTWTAKIGTSGINGRVYLKAYTNGVGSIQFALKGLRANATYSIAVRNGTCANPSTTVSGTTLKMSSTGAGNSDRQPAAVADEQYLGSGARDDVHRPDGQRFVGALCQVHVPEGDARRGRVAQHQSADHPRNEQLSEVQGRDVGARGRPAARTGLHVHLRPRTDGDVPAAADASTGPVAPRA